MYQQQQRLIHMQTNTYHTYQTMFHIYQQNARPIGQTLYLVHQRAREEWDPTLPDILRQPLPKQLKALWACNEWEIPLH